MIACATCDNLWTGDLPPIDLGNPIILVFGLVFAWLLWKGNR